jgi:hypothetical protein
MIDTCLPECLHLQYFGVALCGGRRELELVQIQTQMAQKPTLRAEVYARALRQSNREES